MSMIQRSTTLVVGAACGLLVACGEQPETSSITEPQTASFAHAWFGSGGFKFEPIAASAQCVVGGTGDRFVVPAGYTQEIVTRESSIAGLVDGSGENLFDMLTLNQTGPQAGRYLYRTHEVTSNGALTRTDLWTGETVLISQSAEYNRLDGIAWTPWGTVLFAEETGLGDLYEYIPATNEVFKRSQVGRRSHEGIRVDAQGNVYGISESTPGYVFKFVPDHFGDLTSGTLYALKVDDAASREGPAEWVELTLDGDFDSNAAAGDVGATSWSRPEDVEIGTSTGSNAGGSNVLYVAVTSDDIILRIELHGDDAFVSNFIDDPAGFDDPDNLALSPNGVLFIAEDNGPGDLWAATTGGLVATDMVRFASLRDCGAEPTGIYFDKDGKTLFVDVQHASWEGGDDMTVAIRPGS